MSLHGARTSLKAYTGPEHDLLAPSGTALENTEPVTLTARGQTTNKRKMTQNPVDVAASRAHMIARGAQIMALFDDSLVKHGPSAVMGSHVQSLATVPLRST